ncbi:MAG: DNA mismatch repair protein MutS [Dyadobacter sp. 50-39]|uniref:MutS-related protein n=1 Tax=Dyadobacter sp. 50-39 TaxID=1895756 RepID=UPI00095F747D|nr:DNA mismatch repair protein MutS [Dyadobacter sp. 50-39]OJV19044.1 MAG: DNA mismatch repair protein MutS [Dyadobacter sp. 50-39]
MQPVDRHTLHELQLLPENNRAASILAFYDRTQTLGGADYLKGIITKPKTTLDEVLRFQTLLQAMAVEPAAWQVDIARAYALAAETYYALSVAHSMSQDVVIHWLDTWWYSVRNKAEYYRVQSGVLATLRLVRAIQKTLNNLSETAIPAEIEEDLTRIRKFISSPLLSIFLKKKDDQLSNASIFYLDYHLRVSHKEAFRHTLDTLYKLDACLAIVKAAHHHQLAFPVFDSHNFHAEAAWHPLITNAVANDLELDNPVCILTGANTSGKTTFLKTCGIMVYLAHLGWPVPAKSLQLPFIDRLFTSIHLSDDLDHGFSHFYNEMMRIKQISEALSRGEKCLVVVDELFRGTNQEDALHCSKTVLDGFSNFDGSFFLVSTHIHELITHYAGHSRISFRCFRTHIIENQFHNTFKIEPGAAFEKVGRLIMDQTGVTELLQNAKRPPSE